MVRIHIEDNDGVRFIRDVKDEDLSAAMDEIVFVNGHNILMTEPI